MCQANVSTGFFLSNFFSANIFFGQFFFGQFFLLFLFLPNEFLFMANFFGQFFSSQILFCILGLLNLGFLRINNAIIKKVRYLFHAWHNFYTLQQHVFKPCFFLVMTHYCKIFNWVLDCSLKQPPRRLGAMESPIKTSEIIMKN